MKINKKILPLGIVLMLISIFGVTVYASSWSPSVVMGSGAEQDLFPDAASDDFGNLHVAWTTYPYSRRLYYSRFNGTNWESPQRINSWSSNNFYANITADQDGHPHIVWNGNPYELHYRTFNGSSWTYPKALGMFGKGSVAVRGNGEVFVASYYEKVLIRRKSETWSPVSAHDWDVRVSSQFKNLHLSTDEAGRMYISYAKTSGTPVYRIWEESSWSEEISLDGHCGKNTQLLHGPDGTMDMICYSKDYVNHWHFNGSVWEDPINVVPLTFKGWCSSVNQGPQGTIIISWIELIETDSDREKEEVFTKIWDGDSWLPKENSSLTKNTRSLWSTAGITKGLKAVIVWSEHYGFKWILNSRWKQITLNQPPAADAGGLYEIREGSQLTLNASGSTDPDGDPLTYAWDLDGDGEYDDAAGVTVEASFPDDGAYPVSVRVVDPHGAVDTAEAQVVVVNVPPSVGEITGPFEPVLIGSTVEVSASFTDPGADTWTAVWNWGDGTTSEGAITDFVVSGSHTYSQPGLYTVTLTVTDDDGGEGTAEYQYVVAYDPDAGFVTGGGWIESPGGAYTDDPAITGKANFSFKVQYKKKQELPTGNLNFQFKEADLHLKVWEYEWLVVEDQAFFFQGMGELNKEEGYGFLVAVQVGEQPDGQDSIRIKIWNEETGEVVYDTQPSDPLDVAPSTILGDGSIVIHSK